MTTCGLVSEMHVLRVPTEQQTNLKYYNYNPLDKVKKDAFVLTRFRAFNRWNSTWFVTSCTNLCSVRISLLIAKINLTLIGTVKNGLKTVAHRMVSTGKQRRKLFAEKTRRIFDIRFWAKHTIRDKTTTNISTHKIQNIFLFCDTV